MLVSEKFDLRELDRGKLIENKKRTRVLYFLYKKKKMLDTRIKVCHSQKPAEAQTVRRSNRYE